MAELTTDKVIDVVRTLGPQMVASVRQHRITQEQLMAIYLSLVAGFAGESGESREDFAARATRAFDEVAQAAADADLHQRERLDT